jgi:hypothetical protein
MKIQTKDIITIAVAIALYFVIKKLWKLFGGNTTEQTDPSKTEVDENNLTYPILNYSLWADTIEDQLTGDVFENEQAVLEIFYLLRTTDDVTQLVKAYDRRTGYLGLGSANLWQVIGNYFSNSDKEMLNAHFRRFGIDYRI